MCDWCNKSAVGKPMESGYFLRLVCEHCGTTIDKRIDHANFEAWIKEYYERYIKQQDE